MKIKELLLHHHSIWQIVRHLILRKQATLDARFGTCAHCSERSGWVNT